MVRPIWLNVNKVYMAVNKNTCFVKNINLYTRKHYCSPVAGGFRVYRTFFVVVILVAPACLRTESDGWHFFTLGRHWPPLRYKIPHNFTSRPQQRLNFCGKLYVLMVQERKCNMYPCQRYYWCVFIVGPAEMSFEASVIYKYFACS